MNSELQKFIKEPLVWVGAIALCVPLLASGTLTNIRNMLTFESDPVETSFEKMESTEIKLADRAEVPVDTDWKKSNVSDLPPLPSSSSEADILDNAHASLPTKKPGVSSSLDPGSLLPEMRLYEDDEVNEEVADEKIADDDLSDRQVAGVESADEEMSDEETADSVASKSDEPELDFLFGDEPDLQEEEKPQAAEMATNVPQTPQDESSPDWLFSETDLSAQPSSDQPNLTEFDPISSLPGMPAEPALAPYSHLPAEPALAPYSHLPAAPQLAPYSALPYSPEPELAPYSTLPYSPEQELVPIMPQPATPIEIVSQPHSIVGDAFQSDYFVEVDAGPDWWTPYCQQPFWGAIPTQQTGLDAVIFSALQNSPFVKLINTEPQMAQTLVDEADAKFDWSAFVESSWSDVDRPVVSLLDTGTAGGRFVQQQFLYESGVQKNLRRGGHFVSHFYEAPESTLTTVRSCWLNLELNPHTMIRRRHCNSSLSTWSLNTGSFTTLAAC